MFRKLFGVGALSPQKFIALVVKIGREKGRFETVDVDLDGMTLTFEGGKLSLANTYRSFLRQGRRERVAFIERAILAPTPDLPTTWDELAPMLIANVKDRGWVAQTRLQVLAVGGTPDRVAACHEFAPGLFGMLVVDLPGRMVVVSEGQLAELGVTFEVAYARAVRNLRAGSDAPWQRIDDGLWVAPWDDSYAAARLLLPEVLQNVCADPLVAVPNRDTVYIADASRADAFPKLVALIEKVSERDHYPITKRIFQLEHKVLREATPPGDATGAQYRRMVVEELYVGYKAEKELRDQSDDEVEFCASLMALVTEDEEIVTVAAWMQALDVPTLLPKADLVHFLLGTGETEEPVIFEVPWTIVENAGMLEATDSPMPRWRTGDYPQMSWLESHGRQLGAERLAN